MNDPVDVDLASYKLIKRCNSGRLGINVNLMYGCYVDVLTRDGETHSFKLLLVCKLRHALFHYCL